MISDPNLKKHTRQSTLVRKFTSLASEAFNFINNGWFIHTDHRLNMNERDESIEKYQAGTDNAVFDCLDVHDTARKLLVY